MNMEYTKAQKANLQLKKTAFLPIGFAAMFLICTAFQPAKAQDVQTIKTDTIVTEKVLTFINVEEYPEFPGGEAARVKFLTENIKYPPKAKEIGLEGKVTVGFVVEPDGSISNVTIVRSASPILDEEAIRVTKLMPKWKPEKLRGKAVRAQYHMPITFTLGEGKPKEEIENK